MKNFFSTRFKKLRISKGLTQTEAAVLLDLSPRYVQKIEGGNVNIPLNTVEHISKKLEVPTCHFFNKAVDPDHKILDELELGCPIEVLNLLPMSVCLLNCKGKLIFCNKTFNEKLSPNCGDQHLWDFLSTDSEKQNAKKYIDYLIESTPVPTPFFANQKMRNGSIVPLKIELSYIHNKMNKLSGFVSVLSYHPSW